MARVSADQLGGHSGSGTAHCSARSPSHWVHGMFILGLFLLYMLREGDCIVGVLILSSVVFLIFSFLVLYVWCYTVVLHVCQTHCSSAYLVICGLSPFWCYMCGAVLSCCMSARHIVGVLILSSVVFLLFSFLVLYVWCYAVVLHVCQTHCSSADLVFCGLSPFLILGAICVVLYCCATCLPDML